ncbi:hypothetical protein TNCV_2845671 [Trichonephila clavipes]|nr:hypothetical protein TNCV_2845671 [Trichonephila clavipes]
MDSWLVCPEFEPSTAEDPQCRGGQSTLNMSRLERPPVAVVKKLREEVPAQVSTSVQNDEIRCQKLSSIAE